MLSSMELDMIESEILIYLKFFFFFFFFYLSAFFSAKAERIERTEVLTKVTIRSVSCTFQQNLDL